MKVDTDVLVVLSQAEISATSVTLRGQLERKLYERTNKVLEAAGGKWNRKAKAHVFEKAPEELIENILLTGEITSPKEFGFFPTPATLVARLIELAEISSLGCWCWSQAPDAERLPSPLLKSPRWSASRSSRKMWQLWKLEDMPGRSFRLTSSVPLRRCVMTASPRVHLVGLSVGGIISQAFAIAKPERLRSLTLIDTASTFAEQGREAMRRRATNVRAKGMKAVLQECLDRWFTDERKVRRPDLIDRITKTLLALDPQVHGAMWDMISAFEVTSELHRIAVPTLILTGEFDVSSPPSSARLMQQEITGSEIHIVPGYSHMLPLEAPNVVNDYLLLFLARVTG